MPRWCRSIGLAVALLAGAGLSFSTCAEPDMRKPVQTQSGWIQGQAAGSVTRYLGIPYAAPPVGALRWRRPQDPQPWQGLRPGGRFGSACAQIGGYFGSDDPLTFDRPYGSEDCLYLNVWAPAAAQTPRPVLVFIHGGAGVVGAASLPLYEATRLAGELGVVVVSLNYRLGTFGVIHLPALASGGAAVGCADCALFDQVKALQWVRDNIAAFGGDPENVTVMGHSAGGVSLWALLNSPLASGLLHKAIVLSGIPLATPRPQARAHSEELLVRLLQRDGRIAAADELGEYLRTLGDHGVRDYLYGKRSDEILEAARSIGPLPAEADEAQGLLNPVPTIIGSVDNEASLLLLKGFSTLDTMQLWTLINSGRGDLRVCDFLGPWAYLKFRVSVFLTNRVLRRAIDSSADRLAAASVPVYRYAFNWDHLPQPWRELFGSYHGLDIPFVFGNFIDKAPNFTHFSWTPESIESRELVHRQMTAGIKGFIESGDPARDPSAVQWRRWDSQHHYTVVR